MARISLSLLASNCPLRSDRVRIDLTFAVIDYRNAPAASMTSCHAQ
jgi:hypothetical protein